MTLTFNSSAKNLMDSVNSQANPQPGKTTPSRFDKTREDLNASNDSNVSAQAGQEAQAIKKNFAANGPASDRLRQQVDASSQLSSIPKLTEALASLETQYGKLTSVIKRLPSNATPQQLIALQQRVYDVGESIGMLSKLVDQATSTSKTIFQTQI